MLSAEEQIKVSCMELSQQLTLDYWLWLQKYAPSPYPYEQLLSLQRNNKLTARKLIWC